MRELARLFSFPDDKQFFGSMTAIPRQIDNSVPVNLAKAIALPIFQVHKSRRLQSDSNDEGLQLITASRLDCESSATVGWRF